MGKGSGTCGERAGIKFEAQSAEPVPTYALPNTEFNLQQSIMRNQDFVIEIDRFCGDGLWELTFLTAQARRTAQGLGMITRLDHQCEFTSLKEVREVVGVLCAHNSMLDAELRSWWNTTDFWYHFSTQTSAKWRVSVGSHHPLAPGNHALSCVPYFQVLVPTRQGGTRALENSVEAYFGDKGSPIAYLRPDYTQ